MNTEQSPIIFTATAVRPSNPTNMEQSVKWELAGEVVILGRNVPQCHFVRTNPIWGGISGYKECVGGRGFALILTLIIIFCENKFQSRLTEVSHRKHWLYKYMKVYIYIYIYIYRKHGDCIYIFEVADSCLGPRTKKLPTQIYYLAACLSKTTHTTVLWILIITTQISVGRKQCIMLRSECNR
jgi:hypothetical protein